MSSTSMSMPISETPISMTRPQLCPQRQQPSGCCSRVSAAFGRINGSLSAESTSAPALKRQASSSAPQRPTLSLAPADPSHPLSKMKGPLSSSLASSTRSREFGQNEIVSPQAPTKELSATPASPQSRRSREKKSRDAVNGPYRGPVASAQASQSTAVAPGTSSSSDNGLRRRSQPR